MQIVEQEGKIVKMAASKVVRIVKIVKTVMGITIPTLLVRVDHTRSERALTCDFHSLLYEIEGK